MRLTSTYSRLAVRPFPLTGQIQRVIRESEMVLRENLEKGIRTGQLFNFSLDGPTGKFKLIIFFDGSMFQGREGGQAEIDRDWPGAMITIRKSLTDSLIWYLRDNNFWVWFRQLLHHELIHTLDPKLWVEGVINKMPPYVNPLQGNWKGYLSHPIEKSAYEGETYHFFRDLSDNGVPLDRAIKIFLEDQVHQSSGYRDFIKTRGSKAWQDYLTRVYKSAQQAYADTQKDS